MRPMSIRSLRHALAVATDAAHLAGRLLERRMGKASTIKTKGSVSDLVTEIDQASERIIYHAIRRQFPDHLHVCSCMRQHINKVVYNGIKFIIQEVVNIF